MNGGEREKEKKGGLPARPERREIELRPDPPWPYAFEAEPVEEINIIRTINILLKRRWLIIGGCFLAVFLSAVVLLKTPSTYTASAKFLPAQRADLTARMGTIIGSSGRLESIEENLTSEYYVALMKSNIFLERIAKRNLQVPGMGFDADLAAYYTETPGASDHLQQVIEKNIRPNLRVSADRQARGSIGPSMVNVSYSAREPDFSAAVVNAFLDEVVAYNRDVRESATRSNREFIEEQIAETSGLLAQAENELADFTARNKRIATPDLEVELERLKRNVRIHEEVYISLKKQLELAKIEEQERKPTIEIIERAMPPLQRSSPKIKRSLMIVGFLSLFFFCGLAFMLEWAANARKKQDDEDYREFYGHIEDIRRGVSKLVRRFRKNKHLS